MKYANQQFSHGTLNPTHLLEISREYLRREESAAELLFEVNCALVNVQYEQYDVNLFDLWVEVFEYLETLAEDGYYFGCTEGDDSDIGWWQVVGED